MMRTTADAWVLRAGDGRTPATRGALERDSVTFTELRTDEVLVEPLYGSWEANLDHALARAPIDICRARKEDSVVIGNLGVVRVLRTGDSAARRLRAGQVCMVMPFGKRDPYGYAELIYAYDMPGTVGLLAKRTVLGADMLLPVPEGTVYPLAKWAAYARFFTAWDNWRTALRCWQVQMSEQEPARHLVFGWGGGVALAELQLAQHAGFRTAMTAGSDERLDVIRTHGITAVDRRHFPELSDPDHPGYPAAERAFLDVIAELSDGEGVAILVDNIGAPLFKASLKALSRQGVLASCGWKLGMNIGYRRAAECIRRHLHVNTHVWRFEDSPAIRDYQERTGWLAATDPIPACGFDDIPLLAADYAAGRVASYYPIFQVNPV
jgi:NADPH:quinone reductase-like Zn-dependent oxidoreductase